MGLFKHGHEAIIDSDQMLERSEEMYQLQGIIFLQH